MASMRPQIRTGQTTFGRETYCFAVFRDRISRVNLVTIYTILLIALLFQICYDKPDFTGFFDYFAEGMRTPAKSFYANS
jgi:hypothetical protein